MQKIKVVEYEEVHKVDIVEMILEIQNNEFGISITSEQQPDLHDIKNFYQTGCGNFWVALDGERVVGTASLIDIGNRQAALRKMFVQKAYRGQEYQTAGNLLSTLFDWSESKSINEIYLGTTSKFLAAHRFYEKNRFMEIPKSKLPGGFPVMEVDTKFYMITL